MQHWLSRKSGGQVFSPSVFSSALFRMLFCTTSTFLFHKYDAQFTLIQFFYPVISKEMIATVSLTNPVYFYSILVAF